MDSLHIINVVWNYERFFGEIKCTRHLRVLQERARREGGRKGGRKRERERERERERKEERFNR